MKKIEKYEVLETLEKTNYAEIYKVKGDLKNSIVLKIAKKPDPELNGLIAREFYILSQFKHKNIVKVFDYGVAEDNRTYFTSEFIPGMPINKYFKGYSHGCINAMLHVLDALIQFHNQGYIHSDMKPEHILYIPKQKRSVLIDFGFASLLNEWLTPRGSLGYIAPEILKGSSVDQRSDLYSLGVILYEVLSAQPCMSSRIHLRSDKYLKIDTRSLTPLNRINSNIHREINDTVFRLLATEPALRPTIGDVYEVLIKFSSKKKLKSPNVKMSFPQLPFIDVCEITNLLDDFKNMSGKTFIIFGNKGIGKTRVLNELRFRYLLSRHNVMLFSTRKTKRFFDDICEYIGFQISSKDTKDQLTLFEELTEVLKAKNTNRHLVIMVDDLDELDEFDKAFFRYIGFGIQDSKISLIATSKPSSEIGKIAFENLRLRPFTNTELRELIEKTFTVMMDSDKFSDLLYSSSGGNPLFVEEIIKLLFRRNLLYYKENRWHLAPDVFVKIHYPQKIKEAILSKIESLDSSHIEILQIISLYNNPMEPIILAEIAGLQSFDKIEHLKQQDLIKESRLEGRLAYVIGSEVITEIINRNISSNKQFSLYEKFFSITKKDFGNRAEYIPYIAEYAASCDDVQNAYDYSLKTAELKENMYNFKESIKFLKKSVKYAESIAPENLVHLLMKIGEIENRLGNTDEAISAYSNALKYVKDESANSELYYNIGLVHQTKGQYNDSIDYFNKAISLIKEKNVNYGNLLNNLSYSLIYSGRFSDAHSLLKESLDIAEEMRLSELKVKTLYLFAVLEWFCQNSDEGIEIAKKALGIAQNNNDLNLISKCQNLLGSLYQLKGDFRKAEESYNFVIQLLQSLKSIDALVGAMINLALILVSQAKLEKAIQLLSSALSYARKVGRHKTMARIFINLANVYEIKGDFDKAIELNKQAIDMDPDVEKPVYSLSMIYYKNGEVELANKFLKDVFNISDDPLYHFGLALIKAHSGEIADAESSVKEGFKKMAISKTDFFKNTECYLRAIEFYYNVKKYKECYLYTTEALKFLHLNTREYIIVDAISKLCNFITNKDETVDINSNLNTLKTLNCLFDWAYLKRMEIEALYRKRPESIRFKTNELLNAEEIFKNFGANIELNRIQAIKNQILKEMGQLKIEKSISLEYLNVFYKISGIINNHLDKDDCVDRILDILISTTHAERGILFLIEKPKIKLAAGRNIDKETIKDARNVSRSVIKETGRKRGIICCSDALSDIRFKNSKSVILNQIRSLMCAPLKVGMNTIGAIYLDSKHTCDLFSGENKDFLLTVANLVAATIEKSKIFQKIKEENIFLRMGVLSESVNEYLVGESSATKRIRKMVKKIAKTDSTVLIIGETGCGKGMAARLIHQQSMRENGKFVSVNCGSLPETLFESELFGYKRGAFTGAFADKKGLFEEANGGTLFLDEISNTPLTTQGKLLEAIEEKKIRRLGETIKRKVDIRLITATNQDLKEMIAQKLFRDDLFYRIAVIKIRILPLRERAIDIPVLAAYFLKKYATEMNREILGFDKEVLQKMLLYPWPGNVRELQNAIERAVILAQGTYIVADDLELATEISIPSKQKIRDKEKIIAAIKTAKGNISLAARFLGITRATLYSYIKKYNIKTTKNH